MVQPPTLSVPLALPAGPGESGSFAQHEPAAVVQGENEHLPGTAPDLDLLTLVISACTENRKIQALDSPEN